MNVLQAILLGLVQGLTEFLPVSSSGHLVISQKLLNLPPNLPFDVTVHLATLLAVCLYFWKDILEIFKGRNLKLLGLIILGTIPTGLIGLTFKDFFETLFSSILAVGGFLILTGILILIAEWIGSGKRSFEKMHWWDALIIGTAQGCAIAPGLSRSGTTISASLALGLERALAARFSFLLSILAVLGAGLVEARDILGVAALSFWPLFFGFISALISGYLAIKFLMNFIQKNKLWGFAYYSLALGIILLIWGK